MVRIPEGKIKRAPKDGYTPLYIPADNFEIASALVEVGAPVQAVRENGNTPIYLSVKAGDKEVPELLGRNTPAHLMRTSTKVGSHHCILPWRKAP